MAWARGTTPCRKVSRLFKWKCDLLLDMLAKLLLSLESVVGAGVDLAGSCPWASYFGASLGACFTSLDHHGYLDILGR